MRIDAHTEAALPRVPYRHAPGVMLFLVLAILAITWPWAKAFPCAFLAHWDPPFHAWKLELVARTILSGHLLPHDGNTNMYYPHSGALYFEALHWPQALVASLFFAFTDNSVLVYHIVLILFWALSGVCLWMLLLALGTTRHAALLGAFLFTIMPYRISYMVEFNMQLCFALPLFFFFMVRFFQRPSIRYACGMALAWCLQATSELYQAIFLLLILPFPGLALMVPHWKWLRSFRHFWLPALCATLLGGVLTYVFLLPYLTMLNTHEVNRNLQEISTHILEPLSYLRPGGRFHILSPMDARRDEMIVYPTLVMILLAALHLVFDAKRLSQLPVPHWVWVCRALRWSSLILFLALTFFIYFFGAPFWLGHLYSLLPIVATLVSLLTLLHPAQRNVPALFIAGLFAAAVFSFFMSMGPLLTIRHVPFTSPNTLYLWLYKHLNALQGFRVVSRFSIYLLLFMASASALAWSHIERRWIHRPTLRWLWLLPLLGAAAESIPNSPSFSPMQCPLSTPVLEYLDHQNQPYVLAMAPMGDRSYDSRHMLQIARSDRLFVFAWGGAYPHYTRQVKMAMDPTNPNAAKASHLLRMLWPECFILEDKSISRKSRIPYNYSELFADETDVLAEDERFVLLRFTPPIKASSEQIRFIRHDYLQANPLLTFRAHTRPDIPSATLWLDVNGYPVGRWTLTPESQEFQIEISPRHFIPLLPNRFRFRAENDVPFFLDTFAPAPLNTRSSEATSTPPPSECPPWVEHVHQIPPTAVPLNIHYPHHFTLLACEPLETTVAIGGTLHLRHYVQCPRNLEVATSLSVRTRLIAPDGQWIEEGVSLIAQGDLNDIACQIHPSIYTLEEAIQIPDRLPPGDYKLTLLLRNTHDKRITGTQNRKSSKLFPSPITIRILPSQSSAQK